MGSNFLKETPDDLHADTARQGSDCLEGFCYQDNVRWAVVASITGKRVKRILKALGANEYVTTCCCGRGIRT